MSRNKMKTSYIAFGTVATLAAALAACSGGGGGSVPTAPAGTGNLAAPPTSFGTSVTGPTGTVKVSVVIPQRSGATSARSARMHKLFGPKHADAHIRSMANTSPTASVRKVGAQINKYAAQVEATNRRNSQYVSPSTYYMEFVVTDSTNQNVVLDQAIYCGGGTCTGNYGVPVGTGYNVSLFLYDDCDYLLSVGTASGVAVTQGATTQVPITLNGVAAYVDVGPNANQSPFIADPSEAQTFNVGVALIDADYNTITTPGRPVDESFTPITGISVVLSDGDGNTPSDVTPNATQTLTVSPLTPGASPVPYAYTTSNYTYAGTGLEKNVYWSATTTSSGNPTVPNVATGTCAPYYNGCGPYSPNGHTYASGSNYIAVTKVQLIFTNPEGFPNPEGSPGYYSPGQGSLNPPPSSSPSPNPSGSPGPNPSGSPGNQNSDLFVPQFSQADTNLWALEFPSLYNPGTGYVGLEEYNAWYGIAIPVTATVTLSDNGGCSNVVGYVNSPFSFTAGNAIVNLTAFDRTQAGPSSGCQLVATDNSVFSRTAYLNVYYDNPSLTIQNRHVRSAK
jgi:hypothetical protein